MSYLQLTNISKMFAGTAAVKDFNLSIEQGEFVSFLGPSGCGKTTTLRMIAGFEFPTSGSIILAGKDLTSVPPNKRHVGMVFQSYALFPNLTVAGNIAYGLRVTGVSRTDSARRVDEMLKLIKLDGYGKRYPSQLSGGQQQRVALARALAFRPHVLLLDEPLSALDAKIRLELRQEMRNIQRKLGITSVYVTHDQEEALSLSDRVVVMNEGRIEQVARPMEIYNSPSTEFVASFVGQINLLPVQVIDYLKGIVKVGQHTVRAGQVIGRQNGHQVKLAVRPEELAPGCVEGANNLNGKVDTITYLGAIVRLKIKVDDSLVTMDMFNERKLQTLSVGDPFDISFPVDSCWLV